MPIAFSDPWAEAWGALLNASEVYRTAAATWEGSIAAVVRTSGQPPLAGAYLDIWHGHCRVARAASDSDLAGADFVIEGPPDAWRDLLRGKAAPLMALLTGRIKLTRGELGRLLPYASAAKELVGLAATIATDFPEEWNG